MQSLILLKGMRQSMARLLQQQEQLSTGQRLIRPSDNPIDATAAIRLDDLVEAQNQYLKNIDHASKLMDTADVTVGSIRDLVMNAHDLALENVGSTDVDGQREAAATLVDSIIGQLITLGNTEYLGTHLFAGTRSNTSPYSLDSNQVSFVGDEGQVNVQVSNEISEPINLTARQVFGSGSGQVSSDHDLEPAAGANTRLSDLSGALGQGVRSGTLVIVGSVIGQHSVDLTGSATLGDIIEKVNDALPTAVRLGLAADGRHLRLTSTNAGETLQVLESGQGTVAHDLGLYITTAAASPLVGDDFGTKLTPQTSVTALAQNAGIDLASGITISNGVNDITIDFASAQTVQDILSTINAAGVGLRATINDEGTGIKVVNTLAGSPLRIGENGGTTATDLGIRTFKGDTSLAQLNGGLGVNTVTGADFRITTNCGAQIDVDVSGATTIQDVIDRINAAAGVNLTASIAPSGNGIVLTDHTSPTWGDFDGDGDVDLVDLGMLAGGDYPPLRVERLNLSNAAADLGILKTADAGTSQIVGDDVNSVEEESVFTYLIHLRDALLTDDGQGIEQAGAKLEPYLNDLNRYHGKLGYMAKGLQTRRDRTEDATLSTKALLSQIKDLDYTEAITTFQNLQTALQANLQVGGQILHTSLLDFLG
jgi:flagellar hook-associated protein 3 FlgL